MEVAYKNNSVTNWIEKLGRGLLFLEAREAFAQEFVDSHITAKALLQYKQIYPVLLFCKLLSSSDKLFALGESLLSQSGFSILNGIFFEILKDYIILFQSDKTSEGWRELGSFNMDNQYSLFFTLHPELQTDWDTSHFPLNFAAVMHTFREKKLFMSEEDELTFKRFFLDGLHYYVNIGCLEGAKSLPHPEELTSFAHLTTLLPNLAGLLYHHSLKKTGYFEKYNASLRTAHTKSYKERMIDVAIKCGLCRTEEIGIQEDASVKFFDFGLLEEESGLYAIKKSETLMNLHIHGVSSHNGFTKRTL